LVQTSYQSTRLVLKFIVLSALLAFSFGLGYSETACASNSPSDARLGWALLHDGDNIAAVKLADSKLIKAKDNAAWIEVRAMGLTTQDMNKSLADGLKATLLEPRNAHMAVTYAVLLYVNGQVQKALAVATQALSLDPKDGRTYAIIGMCHTKLGDSKQAGSDFAKALELSPKDFDVNAQAGTYFMAMPLDTHSSKMCFDRLVECFPKSPYSHFLRGDCERADNDIPHAFEDYATCLALNPNYLPARRSRSVLYRFTQHFREAIPDYNILIAAGENVYEGRSDCYEHLNEPAKALTDISQEIKLIGGSTDKYNETSAKGIKKYRHWWVKRAELYDTMGQYANALSQLEPLIKADPNYEVGLDLRQKIYMKMKLYKEAINDLNRLIILHPIADWYKTRALAYDQLGDKAKAAADLKHAQEIIY
jgi:tetratricopeptide (TPR) repeat protein